MDKLTADRQFAIDVLKVDGTPTFLHQWRAMMVGEARVRGVRQTHQVSVENLNSTPNS